MRSTSLAQVCYALYLQLQKVPNVAPLLTDRNWSVAVKVGKRIWLGLSRMLESSAQNSEKQTAKIHSPASIPSLAGPRPCTFYTKHTQNAKINSFPTSRMGVARGSGPHLQPGRLKKLSKFQFSDPATLLRSFLKFIRHVGGRVG